MRGRPGEAIEARDDDDVEFVGPGVGHEAIEGGSPVLGAGNASSMYSAAMAKPRCWQ
jgi:hypothetical protein